MEYTTIELATARDVSKAMLERLGLDAYLFEVEPKEDYWELKLECANENGGSWTVTSVNIPEQLMSAAAEEREKEEQLHEFLRKEFATCKQIKL